MYRIVNEPNLTIAFDMDTELSQFGVFGVYIKQGYNIDVYKRQYEDLLMNFMNEKRVVYIV